MSNDKSISVRFNEKPDELWALRHTASHVLAQAAKRLFPDIKLAIGPAIDSGFYYDFDTSRRQFSDADLSLLGKEVKKIIKEYLQLERVFVVQIIAPLAKEFLTLRIN